jgi:hypothetical protein
LPLGQKDFRCNPLRTRGFFAGLIIKKLYLYRSMTDQSDIIQAMKYLYEKKRDFVREKLKELWSKPDNNGTLEDVYAELESGFFAGLPVEIRERGSLSDIKEYIVKNDSAICMLEFGQKKKANELRVSFFLKDKDGDYGYGSEWLIYDYNLPRQFLLQSDSLAKEYRAFLAEEEKQEKIRTLSRNSIETWLETVVRNTGYSYYTKETAKGITLSIKLKYGMQLNIPVYYKAFQRIIPEIPNTIQKYEAAARESKLKIVIANTAPRTQWKKG